MKNWPGVLILIVLAGMNVASYYRGKAEQAQNNLLIDISTVQRVMHRDIERVLRNQRSHSDMGDSIWIDSTWMLDTLRSFNIFDHDEVWMKEDSQ